MSRQGTEERYRQRRLTAYREAERRLSEAGLIQLDEIHLREIDVMATHRAMLVAWGSGRRVSWQWDQMVLRYRTNYPDRFDLEVAREGEPCAFALGKPSKSRSHCSLEYVEASPDPSHSLKGRVLAVVVTALERYCVALRAPEMRIVQPFPALIPLYEDKYGFALAKGPGGHPYWRREVKP